jgi:hypothetical protein
VIVCFPNGRRDVLKRAFPCASLNPASLWVPPMNVTKPVGVGRPFKPESPQTQASQSDLILQFREQGFHFFSLPLCLGELWRVDQLPRTLSGGFVLIDDKTPEGSTGALWSERARATLFSCPDIVEGSIAINPATVVEELASRTDIAIVFRFVSEALGSEEWTPLSVDTVAGPHIGSDASIR